MTDGIKLKYTISAKQNGGCLTLVKPLLFLPLHERKHSLFVLEIHACSNPRPN